MSNWEVLDQESHSLTLEYVFRPGSTSRAFATRFADDELVIFSPPTGVAPEAYHELNAHGRVTALVAPNGFHYLGLDAALEAFPSAQIFAPEGSARRIAKKRPKLSVRALGELSERASGKTRILDVPGFSTGETWAIVTTKHGPLWYVSDSCFNMPKLPSNFAVRLLLKSTKSAPGLCMNGLGNLFFLKDKKDYKRWFERELEQPPAILVPAHGGVVRDDTLGTRLRGLVETRL